MPTALEYAIILKLQDNASPGLKGVGRELGELGTKAQGSSVQMSRLGTASGEAGVALGGMATKVAGLAAGVVSVAALQSAIQRLGVTVLETGGRFEQLRITLDTLTSGAGSQKLEELNAWAKQMPIDTEAAVGGFMKLKSMGLDPTIRQLEVLVDTTAALGGSVQTFDSIALALGQIHTKGKVSMQELLQLANAGVPVFEILKDKLQLTGEELQDIGRSGLSTQEVLDALLSGLADRFGGQAQRMQDSWVGLKNALASEWKDFLKLVADAGALDWAKEKLRALVDEIERMRSSGELQVLAQELSDALIAVGNLAARLLEGVATVAKFTVEYRELLTVVGGTAASTALVLSLTSAVTGLGAALKGLAGAQAATALASVGTGAATAAANMAAVTPAMTAVGAAVKEGLQALEGLDAHLATAGNWKRAQDQVTMYQQGLAALGSQTDAINDAFAALDSRNKAMAASTGQLGAASKTLQPVVWESANAFTGLGTALKGAYTAANTFVAGLSPLTVALGIGAAAVIAFGEAFKAAEAGVAEIERLNQVTRDYNSIARDMLTQAAANFAALPQKIEAARQEQELFNKGMLDLGHASDNFWSEMGKADEVLGVDTFQTAAEQVTELSVAFNLLKMTEMSKPAPDLEKIAAAADNAAADVQKLLDAGHKLSDLPWIPPEVRSRLDETAAAFNELGLTSTGTAQASADKWRGAYDAIRESASATVAQKQEAWEAYVAKLAQLSQSSGAAWSDVYKQLPQDVRAAVDQSLAALGKLDKAQDKARAKSREGSSSGGSEGRTVTEQGHSTDYGKKTNKRTYTRSQTDLPADEDSTQGGAAAARAKKELKELDKELAKTRVVTLEVDGIDQLQDLKQQAAEPVEVPTKLKWDYDKRTFSREPVQVPAKLEPDAEAVDAAKDQAATPVEAPVALQPDTQAVEAARNQAAEPVEVPVDVAVDTEGAATAKEGLTEETTSTHVVTPDAAAAKAEIAALQQDTSSKHTVYVEKVEKAAVGGLMGVAGGGAVFRRPANPLVTQGSGTKDDVPALLMRNEFVMRRSAVEKYGVGFMHQVNAGQLPPQYLDLVPRFAAGGLVLPRQYLDLVPRFASGGEVAGAKWGAISYEQLLAEILEKRDRLQARLKVEQINSDPASYLGSALGITLDSLTVFKDSSASTETKLATAGKASAALQTQKDAISAEYNAKIKQARSNGNEELADALEEIRIELVAIIEELRQDLVTLAETYQDEVERVAQETQDKLDDLQEDFDKAREAAWERHGAMTEQKAGNSKGSNFFQQQEQAKATKKEAALRRQYTSKKAQAERKASTNIRAALREARRGADKSYDSYAATGDETVAMGRLSLRGMYRQWLTDIQDLEIERDAALAELERSYGTLSVSGFKQFLSQGGLVGLPRFAQGGAVPARSEAWAGVARYARGGAVPAQLGTPGRDSVLAMLMPGEFVLRRDAARVLGQATLQRLNALGSGLTSQLRPLQRFAEGGAVGGGSFAAPQAQGNWGTLTIQVGGGSYPVQARQDVAEALRNELGRMARSSR